MQHPGQNIRFSLILLGGSKKYAHLYLDYIEVCAHAKVFPLDAFEMATHVCGPVAFKDHTVTRKMFNTFIDKYSAPVNNGEWLEPEDGAFVLRTFL